MNNNELISFLKDDKVRFIALKMPTLKSTLKNIQCASDFDIYNALCENIYLLAGNPIRARFLELLSKYSKLEFPPNFLYNLEYRKKLWQRIFFDIEIDLPYVSNISFNKENSDQKIDKSAFCINSVIDYSFENIQQLFDDIIVKIRNSRTNEIVFDARNIIFLRPDDFHSQKAYDACKGGNVDASLIELWLLCRILMKFDLPLNLIINSDEIANQILDLVFKVADVKDIFISFDFSSNLDYNDLYNILLKYRQKNISLELICTKESEREFIEFLRIIPLLFVEKMNFSSTVNDVFNNILEEDEIFLINSHICMVK